MTEVETFTIELTQQQPGLGPLRHSLTGVDRETALAWLRAITDELAAERQPPHKATARPVPVLEDRDVPWWPLRDAQGVTREDLDDAG